MTDSTTYRIDPQTTMGLVSLSIADLDRSLAYYQTSIGLTVQDRSDGQARLGVDGRPLLYLIEWSGARLVRRATGLYHFALLVPSRFELARVLQHLIDRDTPISGAADHRVSEALYLNDPDGHGIEIYRDRPRSAWYDESGRFLLTTERLDFEGIMAELQGGAPAWAGLPAQTVMGHIHLQVSDVDLARHFYVDLLGFEHMADYPQASFVGAGGYHHHLGMNSWMGAGSPPPPPDAARLLSYEIWLPTPAALEMLVARLQAANHPLSQQGGTWRLDDPAGNRIILRVP